MSRYIGPRLRVLRALGVELPGLSTKRIERRPYPPGQHGQCSLKRSDYALHLIEKQKLRYHYGLAMPGEQSIPFPIQLRLVVEFYSR